MWQCHLVMCNTNSGSVIYSCARVYLRWNLNQDDGLEIKACCGLLSTLSGYTVGVKINFPFVFSTTVVAR